MIGDRMQLRLEMPHFKAHCRDGSSYALHLIGLANFKYAWNTGSAFWTGTNAWGEETQIKLADITGLTTFTEESLALRAEEDEEEKRRAITA